MRIKMIIDVILDIPGSLGSLSEVQVPHLGWLIKQRILLFNGTHQDNLH